MYRSSSVYHIRLHRSDTTTYSSIEILRVGGVNFFPNKEFTVPSAKHYSKMLSRLHPPPKAMRDVSRFKIGNIHGGAGK